VSVAVLFMATGTAHAETLSLQEVLTTASSENLDLRRVHASRDQATLARRAVVGRAEPILGLSAGTSTAESRSFLAGQPLETTTDASEVELSVGGRTQLGTSWSASTSHTYVDQLFAVDFSGLLPIPVDTGAPQEQRYWTTTVGATLRQDLLVPFRRTGDRREVLSAREREVQAELLVDATLASTQVAAASAWWQWWVASERVELAEASLARFERIRERVRQSTEVGMATPLDLRLAEQAALEARVQLAQARTAAAAAEDDVLLLLGRSPADDITPAPADEMRTETPSLARILRDNPDARRAGLDLEVAERLYRDAQTDRLPTLEGVLGAGYATLEATSGDAWSTLVSDPLPTYSASVEMNVPLGRTSVRARRDSAAIDVDVAREAVEAVRRELQRRFVASASDLANAELQAQVAEEAVTLAQLELEVEEARAEQGEALLDAVLDATEELRRAEAARLEAQVGVQRAQLLLVTLAGSIAPEAPRP